MLVGLLREISAGLTESAVCVTSGLVPSVDASFTSLVLGWPTVRRTPSQLMSLMMLANFEIVEDVPCKRPGLVVVASPSHGTRE